MANTCLMFGLNKYPGAELSGCINDVLGMQSDLRSMKYFSCVQMRIYRDKQAETQRMLDRINWLVDRVNAGDAGYLHYSGHGAQVDDPNEKDGLAEVICPIDFDWSPQYMITDDQLVAIFKRIKPGAKFNVVFDSCHSGDIVDVHRALMLKNNPHVIKPRLFPGSKARKVGQKMRTITKAIIENGLNVGLLSACTSAQTAADTVIDGKPCGAFTYYYRKALRATPGKPLNLLVDDIHKMLHAAGYEQNPTVDGLRAGYPLLK